MLVKIENIYNRFNTVLGKILTVILLLMTVNVFYDVIMRYAFRNSSVGMQEMEWHLFSLLILFGISFTLLEDGHVRVDFLYHRFSPKKKALINTVGTVLFLLPLSMLIIYGSCDYVKSAWDIGEISDDPGGLPYRWLIKAMIPLSFLLLFFCGIGHIIKNINIIRNLPDEKTESDMEGKQ